MRFKDFLLAEKAMNGKTFADTRTRLGNSAMVGYEFELIVPDHSTLYDNSESTDRPSQVISYFDELEEFEEYFEMSRVDERIIQSAYDKWYETAENAYIDENYDSYMDEDEDEDAAREKAKDKFPSRNYQFRDWLKDDFRDRIDFVNEFGLEPKYGWYEPDGRHASVYTEPGDDADVQSAIHVKSTLEQVLDGAKIEIFRARHEYTKDSKTWYLEPDSSIEGDGPEDHGIEVVSPAMPLDKSLLAMQTVYKWMKKFNLETNSSTGLHINVSMQGVDLKSALDPVKLVLFMGEKHTADLFNRAQNSTAAPQIQTMIDKIKDEGKLPDDANDLIKHAYKYLSNNKYRSVNLSKLNSGYLEFRVAGGENYHYDYNQSRDAVLRFVTALEIACNPDAERQEYMKKIAKFMDKVKEDPSHTSKSGMAEIAPELKRIYILDKSILSAYNMFQKAQPGQKKALVNFAMDALGICTRFKTSLNAKETVYFKKLLKKDSVTSADVDRGEADDRYRKQFKEVYGI